MAHFDARAEEIRRIRTERGLDDPETLRGMVDAETDPKLRVRLQRRLERVEAEAEVRAEAKAKTDAMGPGELGGMMWERLGRVR